MNKLIRWLVVVLWMCLIFYLSHQPATESSELSNGMMNIILDIFSIVIPFTDVDLELFHYFIRKGAHFFAYFILGILVIYALRVSKIKGVNRVVIAIVISVLYAISDEIHQLFIPGRSGEISDVLIDSAGSIVGIALYLLFLNRIRPVQNE